MKEHSLIDYNCNNNPLYADINGEYIQFDLQDKSKDLRGTVGDISKREYLGYGYMYYRNGIPCGRTEHIFKRLR